jgi:hypothetical protein
LWAAALVLSIGFGVWGAHQLTETDKCSPQPGYWSFPTQTDASIGRAVHKMVAENTFPKGGVVGYRDDLLPLDPTDRAGEGRHSAFRGILQYTVAPVILDEGAPHELTLILNKKRTIHLERRQPAGEK